MARELTIPIAATTCPGKGQTSFIKAISPNHPATTVFMKIVKAHNAAKTRLTIATRLQVSQTISLGRLWPGLELLADRAGVDWRRWRCREVMSMPV
jgi:hypothetical protein